MLERETVLTWKQACDEYDKWNRAVYDYFVKSVSLGGQVFLSVDEESLDRIGKSFGKTHKDFLDVMQIRAVRRIGTPEVALDKFHDKTSGDVPNYVGFLAAMVLAAHRMEQEDVDEDSRIKAEYIIGQQNYFYRLRQVLGLPGKKERPEGMSVGAEARFWEAWNRWLESHGWISTAEEGEGSYTYISYPLSQSMMREAENQKLARIFWELVDGKKLSPAYDRDTLLGWMHKNAGRFHIPRLWQLLDRNRSRSRYEATSEGVFGIYCSIDWDAERDQCEKDVHERPVRRIMAGLYREEDPISCEVCYYLYPHQPNKEWSSEKVEIELKKDKWHRLRRSDRAGWCIPLNWGKDPPISFLTLNVKAEGRLRTLKQLVFPNRTHWVLVADPLSSGSVPFANWGSPVVNRSFVVLCRVGLEATMNLLKDKGLISWTGVRTIQNAEQSWKEYIGCTMLTADWPRLELREHQSDFVESLRPNSKALIYFIDGLRVPHERDCWLENYSPRLEILATAGSVSLYCEDLVSGKQQPLGDHSVNTPVHLPSLVPGFYRIGGTLRVAKGGGGKDQELAPRRIEIRSWDRLECRAETPLALSSDLAEEVLS